MTQRILDSCFVFQKLNNVHQQYRKGIERIYIGHRKFCTEQATPSLNLGKIEAERKLRKMMNGSFCTALEAYE